MSLKSNWKHGEYFPIDHPDAVAIFDDEDETGHCDSIYYAKDGKYSPCRTVNRENHEHWTNVISAWACHAPLLDMRNNQSIPLP
jgi:hypothetical protein